MLLVRLENVFWGQEGLQHERNSNLKSAIFCAGRRFHLRRLAKWSVQSQNLSNIGVMSTQTHAPQSRTTDDQLGVQPLDPGDVRSLVGRAAEQLDVLLQETLASADNTSMLRRELSEAQGQVMHFSCAINCDYLVCECVLVLISFRTVNACVDSSSGAGKRRVEAHACGNA